MQSMVFGNMGDTSGTGVAFTRSPSDGEHKIFGEFLVNAQGEDVVAGIRTPQPIEKMADAFPKYTREFTRISDLLENHYQDMQDMEFTVERNKLFMLQTRNGKRTAPAAVKVAVDMEKEGLIDKATAITRLSLYDRSAAPSQVRRYSHQECKGIDEGSSASPGAATGKIYFTAAEAKEASTQGEKRYPCKTGNFS